MNIDWVAGLFEGEGCLSGSSAGGPGHTYWQLRVVSTDRDVLEKFKREVGCGEIYVKQVRNPNWKPAWEWVCARRDQVLALCRRLKPLMCSRRAARMAEVIRDLEGRPIRDRSEAGKRGWQKRRLAAWER